ncbi:MAG TPA: alkaline phosphatase family protein [Blastocatellia bacterium]|jgi:predicted AlkP superfamily phosphohydrolase/phosphomutase|nr:alkaline phosphatase family protein [Blastocatellia bacterium]
MKPKILVIGLDAATMDLVKPWADLGYLPALARLMREGSHSTLRSTPNMHSASSWTSILTGLNPGRHGLFVFSDRDFATGRQLFFKGGDRTGQLITSHLARHELTSGLLNVPMTYPAQCSAGGFAISGLDAPALNDSAFCPKELRAELLGRFPAYNFTPNGLGDLMSAGRADEAAGAWLKLTETQVGAAEFLLESHPVDFFMTVFTASDWAGHNLWSQFESSDRHSNEASGKSLLAIYRALDEAITRLLVHTDDQTQVYVISDHGMGPHTQASYHLAAWLEDNSFMSRKGSAEKRASVIAGGRRAARSLLPPALREKIKAGVGAERMQRLQAIEKDGFYSSIDWSRTVAYAEPGRHVINVNLEARNAAGIVPFSDYDSVCGRISEGLSAWTDPRGVPAVARVVRRDEAYAGPFTERASDLYVQWNPEARFGDPPAEVQARGFWWSGDHRPQGILICKGPCIRTSASLNDPVVYDLVPTLMHLAGLPVPADLDGRVIEELCEDDFRASHPLRRDSAEGPVKTDDAGLSDSEEEMVEEKLRSLGYL